MNPKTREIMEAAIDIAYAAGSSRYYGGDSREDVSDMVQWAIEFESTRKDNGDGSVTYGPDGLEYLEAIGNFADAKMSLKRGPQVKKEPGDLDSMNDRRAQWAANALQHFQNEVHTDDEDAVADLLSDMMHFCDRSTLNFEHELQRARGMYHDETTEEAA